MAKRKNKLNLKEQREHYRQQANNQIKEIRKRALKEKTLNAQLDACTKIICAMSNRLGEQFYITKEEIANAPNYLIKNEPGKFIFRKEETIEE